MSEQRITVGVIGQLAKPVGNYRQEDHQELQDRLEFLGSRLRLNHDGNIIIFVRSSVLSYKEGLVIFEDSMMREFEEELERADLLVFTGTPKFFFDHWYDGTDSNHSCITLESAGYVNE